MKPTSEHHLEAAREGLALAPERAPGIVRATGAKRIDFLNRMSTQRLAGLAPGASAYAAFLDGKARVVAEGLVLVRDEDVLVDADAAAAPALVEHLRRYVLRDDVKLAVEEGTTAVTVLGARAADALARLDVRGFADPRRGAPAWCVPVEVAREGELRRALVAAGAVELSADEAEALRIAAGVPRWGAEIDGSRLVMEAALTGSAVSFEKGCYLGQEVVLRGTFRGQVQRGLVQVRLPEDAGPGAVLRAGEQEVGRVTSAANAPGGRLGLAYLRRAHWAPGTRLATDGGEAEVARPLVSEKD